MVVFVNVNYHVKCMKCYSKFPQIDGNIYIAVKQTTSLTIEKIGNDIAEINICFCGNVITPESIYSKTCAKMKTIYSEILL